MWTRNGGPFVGLRDGQAIAYEFDVHGSFADEPVDAPLRQRAFVLLDEQMQLHQPRVWGGQRAGWWYVDLVEIDVDGEDIRVRDDYIDIVIGPADRPYRMRDLHDYAEALDAGAVTPARVADGLRATQDFLERHLHRRSGDDASWPDFPPADLARLADAPIPDPEDWGARAHSAAPKPP